MSASSRPWLVLFVGLIAIVVVWGLITYEVGGADAGVAVSDVGSALIVAMSSAVIFAVAARYGRGEAVRTTWMLVATGVAAFALGDLTWTLIEVVQGQEVPYPGLPDLFYVLEYPLLATALFRSGRAYRELVEERMPAVVSVAAGLIAAGVLWFGFLGQIVADPEVSAAEKAISVAYPMGDALLLFAPAVFVLLVLSKLAGGALARPWWWVIAGIAVLAASDTTYSWLAAANDYEGGAIVDYGWMLAHVLIASGAVAQYTLSTVGITRRGA